MADQIWINNRTNENLVFGHDGSLIKDAIPIYCKYNDGDVWYHPVFDEIIVIYMHGELYAMESKYCLRPKKPEYMYMNYPSRELEYAGYKHIGLIPGPEDWYYAYTHN